MTEDEKITEWKYDFAWKLREIAERGNNIIDDKAKNIINYSGILIPIFTGFIIYSIEKKILPDISYVFLGIALIALLYAIYYAFQTTSLSDVKIIPIRVHFNLIGDDGIDTIISKTSNEIGTWQKKMIEINEIKTKKLNKSYKCFIASLFFISCSGLYIPLSIAFNHSIILLWSIAK